jgi:hypothetical protein
MNIPSRKIRTVVIYIGLSVAVHLLVLLSLGRFGSYSFASPVNFQQTVMVELAKPLSGQVPVPAANNSNPPQQDRTVEEIADDSDQEQIQASQLKPAPAEPETKTIEAKNVVPAVSVKEKSETAARPAEPLSPKKPVAARRAAVVPLAPPPLRASGEFMATKSEKLSYVISLHGIPVGNMELEAKNENGEIRIALRTTSNSALSSIYPVDNTIEIRHIGGNFIIAKSKQQEGSYKSDTGFTIFLRDKRVYWIDNLRKRYSNETIPNSDVLDTLSSFYYLRNRHLQVGKTELLHVYDGDVYAEVPVEVVRQEEVRLRNLKKVDSLLLRHVKQKGGIFRRTGDMLIWLANDDDKVPVKLETNTPLGDVTIELVSAETQRFEPPVPQK